MRGCFKTIVALGLVAAVAGPVSAQRRGGPGGGWGGGIVGLIANPGVQKELKLDDAQVEKAKALVAEQREKMQENRSKLEGLEGEERMRKRQELNQANSEATQKSLAAFLKPEQVARFEQIELQQRGPSALSDKSIAERLRVTNEQAEKVKTIFASSQAEMRELFQSAGNDPQAARSKVQALRKQTNDKILALMTEDQKKTWKEMTGEPFEVTYPPRNN